MRQCILDHYSFSERNKVNVFVVNAFGDEYNDIFVNVNAKKRNNLISLFGLFPNFVEEGNNLRSNESGYIVEEEIQESDYFVNTYGVEINWRYEGIFLKYREGMMVERGKYHNGYKEGTWKSFSRGEKVFLEERFRKGKSIGRTFTL